MRAEERMTISYELKPGYPENYDGIPFINTIWYEIQSFLTFKYSKPSCTCFHAAVYLLVSSDLILIKNKICALIFSPIFVGFERKVFWGCYCERRKLNKR